MPAPTSELPKSITTYRTYDQAIKALRQLRESGQLEGMVARIISSPYGGYRIKKTPVDLYVDALAEGRRAM